MNDETFDKLAMLFAENGYNATSMQDIANTVKRSKSWSFHHARNKKALYIKILEWANEQKGPKYMFLFLHAALLPDEFFKGTSCVPYDYLRFYEMADIGCFIWDKVCNQYEKAV